MAPGWHAAALELERLAAHTQKIRAPRRGPGLCGIGELAGFAPDAASPLRAVSRLGGRLLLLHGDRDTQIGLRHSAALAEAAGHGVRFVAARGDDQRGTPWCSAKASLGYGATWRHIESTVSRLRHAAAIVCFAATQDFARAARTPRPRCGALKRSGVSDNARNSRRLRQAAEQLEHAETRHPRGQAQPQ
jgi:hypothetical protein